MKGCKYLSVLIEVKLLGVGWGGVESREKKGRRKEQVLQAEVVIRVATSHLNRDTPGHPSTQ